MEPQIPSRADVFFERDVLSHLMASEAPDVAAVAPFDELMQGPAALLSDSGIISGFRINRTAADIVADSPRLFKTLNLLRFSLPTLKATIVPALDDIVTSGAIRAYTEELLAYLIGDAKLTALKIYVSRSSFSRLRNSRPLPSKPKDRRGTTLKCL
ncbi:hypothetical protein [Bradyrhizobium sp. UFLA05-112]